MLKNVFIEVLNLSFTGSFVILVILFARVFLKKVPTKYTYILWSVALVRLVLPFSIESIVSILFVNPKPISQNIVYSETPLINTGITVLDRTVNGSLPASEVVASVNPMQIWVLLGSIIWIIGMIILFTYGITSLVKIKKELQRSTWISENIYSSNAVRTPFVLGLLLPKIYLPNFISETETEYIILHERTHINRRDHIIRFASYLVLCLHWFNPLVWLAFYISGKDMEMSCDESVIKQLGYDLKKDYSQSLLNFTIGTRSFCITPLAFGEGDTKGRIRNILNLRPPKFYVIAITILIVLLVSIGLLSNPINDDLDEQILSGADMAEAVDLIGTVIISEVEVADGKEYEILLTNDSSYTIYELKIALSYPIIITNGHMSNKDSIEADEVVKRVESGSSDIVTVFIPTAYYYEKNYDTENLEIELTGYLDEVVSIKQFGKIGKIEANYSADSEDWIQEASNKPIQAVRAALLNQESKDYTISMGIGSIEIDEAETNRVIDRYIGSELAQSRGWSDDYLKEHFIVVKANYTVEYDHTKTFMDDGILEQYFYLTRDIDADLWSIVDNSGATEIEIKLDSSKNSLDGAISQAILDYNTKYWRGIGEAFENHVTLKTESNEIDKTITAYCIALYNVYEYRDMEIENISGGHIPIKLTFKVNDSEEYELVEYWEAKDGSFYVTSIREAFPDDIEEDAINTQKYIVSQIQSSYQQAVNVFDIDTNKVIENLLEVIMSSPKESSNPGDYIDAHVIEYRELIYYGDYTIAYIERNRDPDASDLRERILEILYGEIAQHID